MLCRSSSRTTPGRQRRSRRSTGCRWLRLSLSQYRTHLQGARAAGPQELLERASGVVVLSNSNSIT